MNRRKLFSFLGLAPLGMAAAAEEPKPAPYRCDGRGGACGSSLYHHIAEPQTSLAPVGYADWNVGGYTHQSVGAHSTPTQAVVTSMRARAVCSRCGCEWRGPIEPAPDNRQDKA